MSSILSLCWVKRNAAKTPIKIKLGKEELEELFKNKPILNNNDDDDDDDDEDGDGDNEEENIDNEMVNEKDDNHNDENDNDDDDDDDETKDVRKKYNLDDYDNEGFDLKADEINTLACFPTNQYDQLLKIKDEGEDSDEEDFEIKSTDNLLICGQLISEEQVCTLDAYIYNSIEHNFYIHHDIILPSYPICVEWLDYDATMQESNTAVNFLAVGTLNPWIEIWDLDILDGLEPEFILTGQKKKKKNSLTKCKIKGHRDAVLDLSWNKLNRNILSSCSADKTIILWDLDKLEQATKIKHHTDKVQTLKFHPIEAYSLLSGSFDHTVALFDCRNPKSNYKTWNIFDGEVEKVLWNHYNSNYFLASTDQGSIYMSDIRYEKELMSTKAHESSVSGLTLSFYVNNLLVTSSTDQMVKIWDIETDKFKFVDERKLNIGSISCAQASPDCEFVFAFGGQESNEPVVWDIRQSKKVRERFYPRMNLTQNEDEANVDLEENSSEPKEKKQKNKKNKFSKKMKKTKRLQKKENFKKKDKKQIKQKQKKQKNS